MTGEFIFDWALLTLSLFNTITVLWLGLTVLLNAERRTWGVWLIGGGLLLGAAFFLSHSAIVGLGLRTSDQGVNFWWQVGWAPVIALPFIWYLTALWYAGFWDDRQAALHRRHRPWFFAAVVLAALAAALVLLTLPLPPVTQVARFDLTARPSVGGAPLLILVYPLYLVLCIGLSLDALRRPGPSGRMMGDLARRRARPWLMAVSVVQLLISLLVGWVMVWFILNLRQGSPLESPNALTFAWFDLAIDSLITTAVLLVGQAMVSYEVFTGKTLPRRGLQRYWHRAVVLAAGYSALVSGSLTLPLRPIYSLLLATFLMAVFYAVLAWRSYAERERYIHLLRPFVTSQRLYEQLLDRSVSAPLDVDVMTAFHGLCEEVLGTRLAYLVALGPLAPLVGPPFAYPGNGGDPPTLPAPSEIVANVDSPQVMCLPIDPSRYAGASWAVPLWSERGLIGVLLLGEKGDGGLYTQEEIEIARTVGERLIDTRASAEIARRLMTLQRQRLVQSQLLDRRARRVLHDEVLPQLHTAMLTLRSGGSAEPKGASETLTLLADAHRQIADLLHELPPAIAPEVARLGLIGALRQAVETELEGAFDDVTWEIEPEAEQEAQTIPSLTAEVLYYATREAIRNAAQHGRGGDASTPLHLRIAMAWRDGLEVIIEDDGKGLEPIEGSDSGNGRGLALHSTMLAVIGGSLSLESVPGAYSRVLLTLPREMW